MEGKQKRKYAVGQKEALLKVQVHLIFLQPSSSSRKGWVSPVPDGNLLSVSKSTQSLFFKPVSSAIKCLLVMRSNLFPFLGGRGVWGFNLSQRVKTRLLYKWTVMEGNDTVYLTKAFQRISALRFLLPAKCTVHWEAAQSARKRNGTELEDLGSSPCRIHRSLDKCTMARYQILMKNQCRKKENETRDAKALRWQRSRLQKGDKHIQKCELHNFPTM